MKENPTEWQNFVTNTYHPKEEGEELSLEIVGFVIFAVVTVLLLVIYLANYYELVDVMEEKLLGSGIRVFLGQLWDFVEVSTIIAAYILEISGVPGITLVLQMGYVFVIAMNLMGVCYAGYLRYIIMSRIMEADETNMTARGQAMIEAMPNDQFIKPLMFDLRAVHDEVVELFEFSTIEMYSLIMFELPQVIMGFYMLAAYKLTENIFLISLATSTLTLGMMLDVVGTRLTYVKILTVTDTLFFNRVSTSERRAEKSGNEGENKDANAE